MFEIYFVGAVAAFIFVLCTGVGFHKTRYMKTQENAGLFSSALLALLLCWYWPYFALVGLINWLRGK
jgi:hypothetical protein